MCHGVNESARSGSFDRGQLITDALAAQGRDDADFASFGTADFIEPLDVMCGALDGEAVLHDMGRWATHRYVRRLLDVRIQLHEWTRGDPGVLDESIRAPIFVIGAPRTGTTVVHRLLASNPALRAAEAWEFLRPVPPPEPSTFESDPRISAVSDELLFAQNRSPQLRTIHTYSARMPKECLSAMAFSFRTEEFVSRYHVPSYVEWLQRCDMEPAYAMHRLVLQVLQRRMPAKRWVLKSPVHLQALRTLTSTYPDAAFVVTHRDPVAVLASASSLVASVRAAFTDNVDRAAIGRYHTELYGRSLDQLVDAVDDGTLDPSRTVHVRHADLVRDPVRAVTDVHEALGLRLLDADRVTVEHRAAEEREDAVGAHRADPADYGIRPDLVRRQFGRYIERFLGT
jgi:hypothetical protein